MLIALRWIAKLALMLATVMLMSLPVAAIAADGQLAGKTLQKAAVKCQKVIAQVSAKVLAGKFKALDACANAALACVQTKQDQGDCFGKARQTCVKKMNGATVSLTKAQDKIVGAKSCGMNLSLTDLLSSDGLGLGQIAGSCSAEFDLDVCEGLGTLAKCLAQTHDQAAGALYGQVRPDTGDLLTRLVALPKPVVGLPTFTACPTCSVTPGHRKAVEQCGRALTKATGTLTAALEAHFAACAQSVLACAQAETATPACLAKASAGCDQRAQKVASAVAKFAGAVGKKCGTETIDFDELKVAPGVNLGTLDACASLEVSPATNAETLAACLEQRTTCVVSGLVQQAIARVGEFGEQHELGALGDDLAATCPPLVAPASAKAIRGARFNFVSSILKFLKRIQLPSSGIVKTVPATGGIPHPSSGTGRGVTSTNAPPRVHFGELVSIPFTYRFHPAQASQARLAASALTLIVTVQRDDLSIDDYFELPLNPPPGVTDASDTLEVVYQDQDTVPGCAFTLALAVRDGTGVSDYTPLLQVLDAAQPTPTPTPTAAPGRFVDNGDGTVTDSATGLQWEKKTGTPGATVYCSQVACPDPHDVNNAYQWTTFGTPDPYPPNGKAFTDFLVKLNTQPCFAGHCDWRLPSEEGLQTPFTGARELETIVLPSCPGFPTPCIDPIFGPTIPYYYWSATTYTASPLLAFNVSFNHGSGGTISKVGPYHVRAVRAD